MRETSYRFRQRPGRFTAVLVVAMLPVMALGIFALWQVPNDPELTDGGRWVAVAIVSGGLLVLPSAVMGLHIAVRVRGEQIRVRLWPLPPTRIALATIRSIETVRTEPLGEFQGLGMKGPLHDRLLGLEGTEAVRIDYSHRSHRSRATTPRRLTILTPQAERLAVDLRAQLARHR